MTDLTRGTPIDVAVIGAGPAGLAAATALKSEGVARVVVLEREAEAGGIPRHCGHPPFGLREFHRILKGPVYAARLVARARAAGVEIHTLCTVIEARPSGVLGLATPAGSVDIHARRVIYATGVRETPRAARLISGVRVGGVLNTGALQSMVYLKHRRPFMRPVILGSELVAFSALMTCQHAGIRPVAIIEPAATPTARWPSAAYARLKGVPLLRQTQLLAIEGTQTVQSVQVQGPDGRARSIACDGVILSGQFTPEAALARCGHLAVDSGTGGPCVDQWGRCSDPAYFATGNLLRPVETAGWSWAEGQQCGHWVAQDLVGSLPAQGQAVRIVTRDPRLKYVLPHRLERADPDAGMAAFQLRVNAPVNGKLVARCDGKTLWSRKLGSRPERRISVAITALTLPTSTQEVEFKIISPEN